MKTNTTQTETFEALSSEFGWTSVMQAPKLTKLVVSSGTGTKMDKKRKQFVKERLAIITGQQPAERTAKKAVATFKSRAGDIVGMQVTLRGVRMQSFFDKLVHVVFPRIKDFRGFKLTSIDEMGNLTLGIKEHTVFPETADEDAKDIFGMAVTFATTAKNKKEAEAFFKYLGVPLR